jgi:AcrR family transcriptional regulator
MKRVDRADGEQIGRRGQPRGVATREKLLAVARELFSVEGYNGTSIGDVARAADVGVGTVYHHFADKRALLLELLDRQAAMAGARVVDEAGGPLARAFLAEDFRESLVSGMLTVRAVRLAEPATYTIAMDLARRDPEIDQACRDIEERFIGFVQADIRVGIACGRARPDLDVEVAARLAWHTFNAVLLQALAGLETPLAERLLRELADMLAHYLLVDPAV